MNEELQLSKLSLKDLDNVLALQEKIIANLPDEQKYFTIRRSREDFAKALSAPNLHMFGIYVGKKLVAQSLLNFPEDNNPRDIPEFANQYKNSEIAIYQAVLVDPDYRGLGLMKRMLQAREDMAVLCGKKVAICKIAANNHFSWTNALKHGMQIMAAGTDASGHKKLYLQKKLNSSAVQNDLQHPRVLISLGHRNLGNLAYNMGKIGQIGIWDKENRTLAYVPSKPKNIGLTLSLKHQSSRLG